MNEYGHDLLNALYTLRGLAEVRLEERTEGGGRTESDRQALEKIKAKAEEALFILKRLRTSSGEQERMRSSSAVTSLVSARRAFESARKLLAQQGFIDSVQVLNRVPQMFPPLLCHRGHFRELLYHLMKNSLEALKEKTEGERCLIIEARITDLEAGGLQGILRLTDNGIGIESRHLGSLFRPFFTTKPEGKGNGLGLYLAKRLAEGNQGRIAIESFPNEGTMVSLAFPLSHSAVLTKNDPALRAFKSS